MTPEQEAEAVLAALGYVPDVGETFIVDGITGPEHYRVTAWLCRRPPRPPHPDPRVEELLAEMDEKYPRTVAGPDRVPLMFCRRDQAEYVCGAGVGGTIQRARNVKVDGRVPWSAESLDAAREHAELLAGEALQ